MTQEMWEVLTAYQPQANKNGHGDSWAKMCREKTASSAADAAKAAYCVAYVDAYAAEAASEAAHAAASSAVDAAAAQVWAQKAIKRIDAVIKPPAQQQEPVAWMFQHEETGRTMCIDAQQLGWGFEKGNLRLKKIAPLYTTPPQRTWAGLMRGVRVDGDTVVITVKGGDDAARELCVELLKEKNECQ